MKTLIKILVVPLVLLSFCCEADGVIEEQIIEPPVAVEYNWEIVVQSVNSTTEPSGNDFFSYFILGQPSFGFEGMINSTLFRMIPNTNRVEIKKTSESSFVLIWGWAGHDPPWEFTYKLENNQFVLDGVSTQGITFYCYNDNPDWLNTFHFEGELDTQANQPLYNGTYVWTETKGADECIKIEGDMIIKNNLK